MTTLKAPCRPGDAARPDTGQPSYTTEQLFDEAVEILLVHGDETYRLRRTARGKLILTK